MTCFILPTKGRPAATKGLLQQLEPVLNDNHLSHFEQDSDVAEAEGWRSTPEAWTSPAKIINGIAREVEADLYVFLHSDMVLYPGWYETLVEAMGEAPDVWMAGPATWPEPATPELPGEPCDESYWDTEERDPIGVDAVEAFRRRHWSDYLIGSQGPRCFRREAWEALGGWDERFEGWHGFEDLDFERRIFLAGKRAVTFYRSVVWHRGMGARAPHLSAAGHSLNKCRFLYKHRLPMSSMIRQPPVPEEEMLLPEPWRRVDEGGETMGDKDEDDDC